MKKISFVRKENRKMKTQEELSALKEEVEILKPLMVNRYIGINIYELEQVIGGA